MKNKIILGLVALAAIVTMQGHHEPQCPTPGASEIPMACSMIASN